MLRRVLARWNLGIVILVLALTGALAYVTVGQALFRSTCTITGRRKTDVVMYFPSWRFPSDAFLCVTLDSTVERTAISRFLQSSDGDVYQAQHSWETDSVTILHGMIHINQNYHGRARHIIDPFPEGPFYDFLQLRHQQEPDLPENIREFLRDPFSLPSQKWQSRIVADYARYLGDQAEAFDGKPILGQSEARSPE